MTGFPKTALIQGNCFSWYADFYFCQIPGQGWGNVKQSISSVAVYLCLCLHGIHRLINFLFLFVQSYLLSFSFGNHTTALWLGFKGNFLGLAGSSQGSHEQRNLFSQMVCQYAVKMSSLLLGEWKSFAGWARLFVTLLNLWSWNCPKKKKVIIPFPHFISLPSHSTFPSSLRPWNIFFWQHVGRLAPSAQTLPARSLNTKMPAAPNQSRH